MIRKILSFLGSLALAIVFLCGAYGYDKARRVMTDPYAPCAKLETQESQQACRNQIGFAMSAGW